MIQELLILTRILDVFEEKCVRGIQADPQQCLDYAEKSLSIATALNPVIGYEKAAEAVKTALKEGSTIRKVVLEKKWMTEEKYNQLVRLDKLVNPHGKSRRR